MSTHHVGDFHAGLLGAFGLVEPARLPGAGREERAAGGGKKMVICEVQSQPTVWFAVCGFQEATLQILSIN